MQTQIFYARVYLEIYFNLQAFSFLSFSKQKIKKNNY